LARGEYAKLWREASEEGQERVVQALKL
jgi:hypothetical protein